MDRKNVADIYPLSPLQQGILFHSANFPGADPYAQYLALRLLGPLRAGDFAAAWQEVLDRHPALRTGYLWEKLPQPLQVVFRTVELPMAELDWSDVPEEEREPRLRALMEEEREDGFDLQRPPLLRLILVRMGPREHVLAMISHHLVLDGWSLPVMVGEAMAIYRARLGGTAHGLPAARPFRDYVTWLQKQDLARAESFWRGALEGIEAPTPLWGDRAPETFRDPVEETEEENVVMEGPLVDAIAAMTRQHRVTPSTLLQGAWGLMLARAAGAPHALFGGTVSGRPAELEGVERMVGMFINTVPVRVDVPPSGTVLEWLRGLQAHQAEARDFEFTPLVSVHGWSRIPRDLPLFESLLVFENFPQDAVRGLTFNAAADPESDEITLQTLAGKEGTSYALTLTAHLAKTLRLTLAYDARRIDRDTARRYLLVLSRLLVQMVDEPGRALASLSILSPLERRRLLVEWNDTGRPYPAEPCIHHLFEARARERPEAPALIAGAERLTYGELDARANRLARRLRALGVGPERTVAVCMERDAAMVVSLLAILKTGGAYVPVDPAYPAERIAFMLEDSGARVVLTRARLADALPPTEARVLRVDADAAEFADLSAGALEDTGVEAANAAYVIYTSGSTGRPKGVVIEHRNTVQFVHWMRDRYPEEERRAVLGSTSISFDVSVAELFGSLCWGGTLVLVENALGLATLPAGVEATMACMVPSAAAELLRTGGIPASLRVLNLAGEPLPPALAQALHALGTLRVVNVYGPTEDTTYSTYWEADGGPRVLIGAPIANAQDYVLDDRLEPVPAGAAGELFLAGSGVARGYHRRPALTAERFLPNPFGAPGARMYRVGDLARWREGGELEYLGRVDHQVKIRGFRIETGEVEATLAAHPSVRETVVAAREDAPGELRLVAYVVPAGGAAFDAAELRAHLRRRLPEHMVPTAWVALERIPTTPNGKTDRRALPAPEASSAGGAFVAADSPVEETLAGIWAEVLGMERVGVNDSFFDLGGHSLLLVRVQSRIREALGREVGMVDLFRFPTVRALAARLEEGGAESEDRAQTGRDRGAARRAARDRRERRVGS